MVDLAVCIEAFWRDLPMQERIRRVKALGFKAFEVFGWRNKDLESIRVVQKETGLVLVLLAAEPGLALVDRANDKGVLDGFVESVKVAHSFDCCRLISMVGMALADETWETTWRRVVRKLRPMAHVAESEGITVLLEPWNAIVDHKGSWLTRMSEAVDLVEEVGSPNVKVLDDLYHQQITEGNLLANFRVYAPWIGHVHAAGVPGRHELAGCELDYKTIFAAIRSSGYNGYIGLEFKSTIGDDEALKQALSLL